MRTPVFRVAAGLVGGLFLWFAFSGVGKITLSEKIMAIAFGVAFLIYAVHSEELAERFLCKLYGIKTKPKQVESEERKTGSDDK